MSDFSQENNKLEREGRKFRRDSEFGHGPRKSLCRELRARFLWRIGQCRRRKQLTANGKMVAETLVKMLGADGRLDPSHATLAGRVGCNVDTVRLALNRLRALGLATWVRRLVRTAATGWRVEQTSNAYVLTPPAIGESAAICCDPDFPGGIKPLIVKKEAREAKRGDFEPAEDAQAARRALAEVAEARKRRLGFA
jgi:hypothetical protein